MDPIQLVKTAWLRTPIIFPGLMLCAGAGLAVLPTTGGRLVCDRGMCVQEHTAALGTVREAVMYPTSEIEGFWVERGAEGEMTRVVIELHGANMPLTIPFTSNERDVDRIASEGSRFLAEGAQARFVAALEVQGVQSFFRPFALLLLLAGTGFASWIIRSARPEGYRA